MKIKVKINYNTLKILCDLYDGVCENYVCHPSERHFDKDFRACKNIIDLLFISLKKKIITKQVGCKDFNISLEYYQAYFLVNFLSANVTFLKGIYEQNTVFNIMSKIHQEL